MAKAKLKATTVRLPDRLHALAGAGAREAGMSVSAFLAQVIERQLLTEAAASDTSHTGGTDAREARNLAGAIVHQLADVASHIRAAFPLSGPQTQQAKVYRKEVIERVNEVLEDMEANHGN